MLTDRSDPAVVFDEGTRQARSTNQSLAPTGCAMTRAELELEGPSPLAAPSVVTTAQHPLGRDLAAAKPH